MLGARSHSDVERLVYCLPVLRFVQHFFLITVRIGAENKLRGALDMIPSLYLVKLGQHITQQSILCYHKKNFRKQKDTIFSALSLAEK